MNSSIVSNKPLSNKRGVGLAEIIIIAVLVTFVTLVSLRIMKKSTDDANLKAAEREVGVEPGTGPAGIIKGAKDKLDSLPKTPDPEAEAPESEDD